MTQASNTRSGALRWIGKETEHLGDSERAVLAQVEHRLAVSTQLHDQNDKSTIGEKLADRVAAFGGSWKFILMFGGLLLAWTLLNSEVLGKTAFDPYPYIFLNLLLSMMAAFQAPVIMMSQNRQSTRDRQNAENDYAVNLKSEIEIMALHEKFDAIRVDRIVQMLEQQQQQIDAILAALKRA